MLQLTMLFSLNHVSPNHGILTFPSFSDHVLLSCMAL